MDDWVDSLRWADTIRPYREDAVDWADAVDWVDAIHPYMAGAADWADAIHPYRAGAADWADAICWADAVRPYNSYDTMEVVGHDNEFILVEENFTPDGEGSHPFVMCNFPQWRQVHFAIKNIPEYCLALISHDGDKVGPWQ